MSRNLVLCCDGTSNKFGAANTNVVKLLAVALQQPEEQLVFYDPGVGTFSAIAALTPAALMFACGLVRRQHRNLIAYAIELFKSEYLEAVRLVAAEERRTGTRPPLRLPLCHAFAETFSERPRIHFMGLWDTVGSVGSVYNPLKLPFTRWNPIVRRVRHAVAIDERRKFFRQNLWSDQEHADIKQVWFAGDHGDVGGGYPEAESG